MNKTFSTITSPPLRLLPVSKAHLTERYISWLNNPEVVKYSELRHRTHSYESCYHYWQFFQDQAHLFCAIEINQSGNWLHIGNINAIIDENNALADVGILIGESTVWGKGYGTLAWQFFCNYLLTERKMRKVTAGTMSINHGMLNIMKKVGMVEDGKRIRQYFCDGQEVDICHYALFKK